jgi:anhydro-N-acetylmuramic acid kinase
MRVAGLISGTSMDGIDVAAVEIEADSITLLRYESTPYPQALRAALDSSESWGTSGCLAQVSSLNFEVGEAFARAAIKMQERVPGIALIGSHGQTVFHEPRPSHESSRRPSTLQIGEPAVIAVRTGVTTVADFRVADVAAGGQGAPLVSFIDYRRLASSHECRVALNIGGIANVTIMPAGCTAHEVRAFDTGPGNILIDRAVRTLYPQAEGFDRGGRIAATGSVNGKLLAWLVADPFIADAAPKTTGRERFGAGFFARALQVARDLQCNAQDVVATLTEFSARTIASAIPDECRLIVVSGGGAHNCSLLRRLEHALAQRGIAAGIARSDEFGMDPDAKEAMAFAILAYEALHGHHNTLHYATGARAPVISGKIVPGANFVSLMRSIR